MKTNLRGIAAQQKYLQFMNELYAQKNFNRRMMEETAPGFVTMFCEKRLVSTVRDPFAGVRASAA